MSETVTDGIALADPPEIKSEPIDDPLFEAPVDPDIPIKSEKIIPKEYVVGTYDDSDCEDILFFTQVELDNTRKCLENTRLIIKDFETQLDWHLEQYLILRDVLKMVQKEGSDEPPKRQDLLSISQLTAVLAKYPECNKKFINRRGQVSNGVTTRKRRRGRKPPESEEEEEETEEESEEEEYDEEYDEDADDPPPKSRPKRKTRGRKGKYTEDDPLVVPKDEEIEEEIHELVVPKEELDSNEEEVDEDEEMEDDEEEMEEDEEEMEEDEEEMEEDEEEEEKKKPPPKKGGKATPAKSKSPAKKK